MNTQNTQNTQNTHPPESLPPLSPHPADGDTRAKRVMVVCVVVVLLAVASQFAVFYDYQPPLWALQIELSGGSAYGPEMAQRFRAHYDEPFASGGFGYPLPVMWLALPIVALPTWAVGPVWCILGVGSVLVGLYLLRMPIYLVFFLPLPLGALMHQVTVLITGLLLIGIWAWRTRRWWIVGMVIALTVGAKPQAALLVAGVLALLAVREGAWKPLLVCAALVGGATFALEPGWVSAWLAAVARYRAAIGVTWATAWLPVALVLLWRRHYWGSLAVCQIGFFPTLYGYSLLPLLVGYVDRRAQRFALLAVACSWLMAFLSEVRPFWLVSGVCYLTPLLVSALAKPQQHELV